MTKKIGIAVLGCGFIAPKHLEACVADERCELIAVCTREPDWAEEVRAKYNAKKAYTDYHDVLSDPEVDAVSICLPNNLHAKVTIEALEAGKDVLCEKPMATNADEARAMIEARDRSGRTLMILQNQRFIPAAQKMKRMIDNGELGEIYHIRTGWRRPLGMLPSPDDDVVVGKPHYNRDWYNDKDACGGVLRDLGVHLLDLAMYLTGFPKIKDVAATLHRKFEPGAAAGDENRAPSTSEDLALAHLEFENGMSLSMEVSFGTPIAEEQLFTELYGTKGGAERKFDDLRLIRSDDLVNYTVEEADLSAEKPFLHCIHEFLDVLCDGRENPCRPEDSLYILEMLDRIYAAGER